MVTPWTERQNGVPIRWPELLFTDDIFSRSLLVGIIRTTMACAWLCWMPSPALPRLSHRRICSPTHSITQWERLGTIFFPLPHCRLGLGNRRQHTVENKKQELPGKKVHISATHASREDSGKWPHASHPHSLAYGPEISTLPSLWGSALWGELSGACAEPNQVRRYAGPWGSEWRRETLDILENCLASTPAHQLGPLSLACLASPLHSP